MRNNKSRLDYFREVVKRAEGFDKKHVNFKEWFGKKKAEFIEAKPFAKAEMKANINKNNHISSESIMSIVSKFDKTKQKGEYEIPADEGDLLLSQVEKMIKQLILGILQLYYPNTTLPTNKKPSKNEINMGNP